MSAAPAEVLHGGAARLPIRYVNEKTEGIGISRYLVAPGQTVSRHVHTGKTEYWVIVSGSGAATVDQTDFHVGEGDVISTPPGNPHSLSNTGDIPLIFINVVERTGDEPVTTTEIDVD